MFKEKRRNVDTVIRDLNEMVTELLEVKADCLTEFNDLTERLNALADRRTVTLQESDRAAGIAEKIAELIS